MPESAMTGEDVPSWFEIRQPTVAECEKTGASPDGVVVLHQGDIVALHNEYGTVELCLRLKNFERPETLREWIEDFVSYASWISERVLKETKSPT